ncbi:MAG TPA: SDR family oxidoreductase [Acidocella sp.]|nr:SDR family oxidoreductase [Acidocella sp.]HQU04456.1 SDR family oxidoreductase [Acidocella sp.]
MPHHHDPLFAIAGQNILVAGGAGGLGWPIAQELAQRGANVAIADLNEAKAASCAEALRRLGAQALATGLNVTSRASCAAACQHVVAAWGRLDGLVNASGIYRVGAALDLADQDWQNSIDINLTGSFQLARAAGALMVPQKSGSIITITSVSSHVANQNYAAYAASKAGAAHLTRVLALEWAAAGVRVNAIGPAVTPTPLAAPIIDNPTTRDAAFAKIPMQRFGTPDDLLASVVFLLADGAKFLTGQIIYVDGGRTIS